MRTQIMVRISLRIDWELAASVFDAAFRRYLLHKKVNVHQVLGDLLKLRQFLTGEPILALLAAPFAVIFAAVAWVFHPYLGMFIVGSMLIMVAAAYLTKELSTPVLKAANDTNAEANRLAAQSLRNAETAFALGMQGSIRQQWLKRHQSFLELQLNATEAAGVLGGITAFLGRLLPSATIALAIWLAISGHITGGMVIAGIFLLNRAMHPLQTVLRRWPDIAGAREAYRTLNALLAQDEAYSERMTLPAPAGQLRVKDLSVKPPKGKQAVLQGINLSVEPGQALAVLGPSASGKSSLTRALIGLWAPLEGSVRLDGAEVSDWLRGDLGQHIGYVPQDIEFFEGSIAENVARLAEVDADEVVAATRAIGLHAMVLTFPKGYETRLGENRHPLTGGQKQRLAIARALYRGPKFLVLDEPDASLDENGQRALLRALREAKRKGATIVFTTHRSELLELADQVLVLSEGRMHWCGAAEEFRASMKQAQLTQAEPPAPAGRAVTRLAS
jgi:PrtD family type I secretion system ABC transporter